ncbi:hypothetical protein Lal_00013676 [Lupinus albus]|nr:hypothetical protein Lal_00013676 [Lupinus albus]
MLDVRSLDLHYGAAQALRGVSMKAEIGKVTCLVGRNGVGKSSLLRAIVGLKPVSGGSIGWDGADVTKMAPADRARRGIAYVPQGPLDPRRGVRAVPGAEIHAGAPRRRPVGRPAAAARHRPRPGDAPAPAGAGRADRGHPAVDHQGHRPRHLLPARQGHHGDPAGRAVFRLRPRPCRRLGGDGARRGDAVRPAQRPGRTGGPQIPDGVEPAAPSRRRLLPGVYLSGRAGHVDLQRHLVRSRSLRRTEGPQDARPAAPRGLDRHDRNAVGADRGSGAPDLLKVNLQARRTSFPLLLGRCHPGLQRADLPGPLLVRRQFEIMPEGRALERAVAGIGQHQPVAPEMLLRRFERLETVGLAAVVGIAEVAEIVAEQQDDPVLLGDVGAPRPLRRTPVRLFLRHQEGIDVAAHREAQRLRVAAGRLLLVGVAVGDVEHLHAFRFGVLGELHGTRHRRRLLRLHPGIPGLGREFAVGGDQSGLIGGVVHRRLVQVQHDGRRQILVVAGLLGRRGPALVGQRLVQLDPAQRIDRQRVRLVFDRPLHPQLGVQQIALRHRALGSRVCRQGGPGQKGKGNRTGQQRPAPGTGGIAHRLNPSIKCHGTVIEAQIRVLGDGRLGDDAFRHRGQRRDRLHPLQPAPHRRIGIERDVAFRGAGDIGVAGDVGDGRPLRRQPVTGRQMAVHEAQQAFGDPVRIGQRSGPAPQRQDARQRRSEAQVSGGDRQPALHLCRLLRGLRVPQAGSVVAVGEIDENGNRVRQDEIAVDQHRDLSEGIQRKERVRPAKLGVRFDIAIGQAEDVQEGFDPVGVSRQRRAVERDGGIGAGAHGKALFCMDRGCPQPTTCAASQEWVLMTRDSFRNWKNCGPAGRTDDLRGDPGDRQPCRGGQAAAAVGARRHPRAFGAGGTAGRAADRADHPQPRPHRCRPAAGRAGAPAAGRLRRGAGRHRNRPADARAPARHSTGDVRAQACDATGPRLHAGVSGHPRRAGAVRRQPRPDRGGAGRGDPHRPAARFRPRRPPGGSGPALSGRQPRLSGPARHAVDAGGSVRPRPHPDDGPARSAGLALSDRRAGAGAAGDAETGGQPHRAGAARRPRRAWHRPPAVLSGGGRPRRRHAGAPDAACRAGTAAGPCRGADRKTDAGPGARFPRPCGAGPVGTGGSGIAGDADAVGGIAALRRVHPAHGGADIARVAVPRPAAHRPLRTDPCGSAVGGAVLHPLPDIAQHVVKAEAVGAVAADRRGEQGAVAAVCHLPVDEAVLGRQVGDVRRIASPGRIVPPPARGSGTGAGGIFPFRPRQQAIALAGPAAEPVHIGLGVVPAHTDRRIVVRLREPRPAPGEMPARQQLRLSGIAAAHRPRPIAAVLDEAGIFAAGDRIFADGDGVPDRCRSWQGLVGKPFRLRRRGAPEIAAGGDGDQDGRVGMVPQLACRAARLPDMVGRQPFGPPGRQILRLHPAPGGQGRQHQDEGDDRTDGAGQGDGHGGDVSC